MSNHHLQACLCLALATGGCGIAARRDYPGSVDAGQDAEGLVFSDGGAPLGSIHAPAKIVEIATSSDHVCARLIDDRVYCWGALQYNVCDTAAGNSWPAPRLVTSLSHRGIVQMALPGPHCAVLSSGQVLCWGSYIPQILGAGSGDLAIDSNCATDSCPSADGGPDPYFPCSLPEEVPIDGVTRISTGMEHACATRTDGTVWCWGWDRTLQAYPDLQWTADFETEHDGSGPLYCASPRQVPSVTGAIDVASGTGTCTLVSDGTVQCWGGATPPGGPRVTMDYESPIKNIPIDHVVQIAVGDYTAFALRDDGAVFEFTFGPGAFPIVPFEVPDLDGAVRLFATPWDATIEGEGVRRGEYVAALFPDGSVRTHSVDVVTVEHDDAGDPVSSADGGYEMQQNQDIASYRPALPVGNVAGAEGARLVATAELVLCVVLGDDEVRCEGDNAFGQLGRATVGGSQEPLAPVIWPPEVATSH